MTVGAVLVGERQPRRGVGRWMVSPGLMQAYSSLPTLGQGFSRASTYLITGRIVNAVLVRGHGAWLCGPLWARSR